MTATLAPYPPGTAVRVLLLDDQRYTPAEVRCYIPRWCDGEGAYSVRVLDGRLAGQCATVPARRLWRAGEAR